jgi:type IV secretory pathway TrbD component
LIKKKLLVIMEFWNWYIYIYGLVIWLVHHKMKKK